MPTSDDATAGTRGRGRRVNDVPGTETWANGEIVRNILALTDAVENLSKTIERLDARFLSTARYDADEQRRHVERNGTEEKHVEFARWLTDLAADQERTKSREIPTMRDMLTTSIATLRRDSELESKSIRADMVSRDTVWKINGLVLGVLTTAVIAMGIYFSAHTDPHLTCTPDKNGTLVCSR